MPWNKPKFDKDLGPRCFSCNEYGHYSSRCPTKSTSESSQINRPTILRTESVGWKTDQRHGGRHWSRQDSSPIPHKQIERSTVTVSGLGNMSRTLRLADVHMEIDGKLTTTEAVCILVPVVKVSVSFVRLLRSSNFLL